MVCGDIRHARLRWSVGEDVAIEGEEQHHDREEDELHRYDHNR